MVPASRNKSNVSFIFASDPALIHQAVCQAETFIMECGFTDDWRVSVVLRELLANAIVHGNKNDLTRKVACRVDYLSEGIFKIQVEDEGDGFDYSDLNVSVPEDARTIQNRGYVLIKHICSGLQFNSSGNRVTAFIQLDNHHVDGTL